MKQLPLPPFFDRSRAPEVFRVPYMEAQAADWARAHGIKHTSQEDCTSPVVIPGVIDFTQQGNDAFARFAAAGMHVVKSTDPIETWPEVNL